MMMISAELKKIENFLIIISALHLSMLIRKIMEECNCVAKIYTLCIDRECISIVFTLSHLIENFLNFKLSDEEVIMLVS